MLKYDKTTMDEQDDMLREIERMKKKQQILKMHPNKIYSSENPDGIHRLIHLPEKRRSEKYRSGFAK